MYKKILVLILSVLISMLGCKKNSNKNVSEITGENKEKILEYAIPITDNILNGFNEGNYEKYSLNFDETMKKQITEAVFNQTIELIESKIGKYKSKEVSKVLKHNQYVIVLFKSEFENENDVTIKVVFQKIKDQNLVAGLWFYSVKLQQ